MVIDLGRSKNVPKRTLTGPPAVVYWEIVFAPNGEVLSQESGNGKVLFWVKDINAPNDGPRILSVQTRTGYIGAFDVAPGTNAYAYTEEGRSSGL
jgi:hypothetical protein